MNPTRNGKRGIKRKLWRGLAALMALVSLMTLLAGCKADPKSIFNKAVENSKKTKSYHSAVNLDLGMGSQGITQPQKTKGSLKLGMMGFNVDMDMYGDESYAYMGMNGQWQRSPLQQDNSDLLNPSEMMSMYTEGIKEVTLVGEEEVEGQACYKMDVQLSGEKLKELVEKSLAGAMNSGQIIPEVSDTEDMTVQMWIDKAKNRFVKIDADLSVPVQQLLADAMEGMDVTISKYTMTMTISNYDGVEDFEIPAEVLNAEEADSASPLPF